MITVGDDEPPAKGTYPDLDGPVPTLDRSGRLVAMAMDDQGED